MVFTSLSDRLTVTFKNLRGKGRLSESDVNATIRDIRVALLDADVALPVVREFTGAVRERALGAEVIGYSTRHSRSSRSSTRSS